MNDVEALIEALRRSPGASSADLITSLGIGSQPTFSRLVARAGDRVVAIGRARARRYAAARGIPGVGAGMPLFRVDDAGGLSRIATVRALEPEGFVVDDPDTLPRWMRGRRGDGVFEHLPPFLADLLPRGFAGRAFASVHPELGLPADLATWSSDERLVALANAGDDAIGDLVPGEASARRLYEAWQAPAATVARTDRVRAYPALAEAAIAGIVPGAGVGGDQPKFATAVADGATTTHAIVKFTSADYSTAARRWCDLVVCEHLALETLRGAGLPAATSSVLEGGSRFFLEVVRFDRTGERGRRPVVTLDAMAREYAPDTSARTGWVGVAEALSRDRWIAPSTLAQIRELHAFGRFLANTDLSLDNLSLVPRDDGALALAPVYDMLPMGYAPVADEVPARTFAAPPPDPGYENAWSAAGTRAIAFWRAVARDERVSQPFRAIASSNAEAVERALARFAPA